MSLQGDIGLSAPFAGPLYAQVAAMLRGKICSSEWSASEPLPNEAALAKDMGVSIGTVRKALEMLEQERLINRRQGRGTFIVQISEETELQRFSNFVSNGKKLKAETSKVTSEVADANADEILKLRLKAGDKVIRLETVWGASQRLKAFEKISVPHARFPGLERQQTRTGQFLFPLYRQAFQVVITQVAEKVSCINADDKLAEILGVRPQQAVLQIDRIARAMTVGDVEWSTRFVHLTDAHYAVLMS